MSFIPPRPAALQDVRLRWWRFLRFAHSWMDVLTQKSYVMLLGHVRLPLLKLFIVNDPVWVERILVQEPARFPKHRLMNYALEPLLGGSPFATNGDHWRRQRRMLDQAMTHARLGLVFPLMGQACAAMMAHLDTLPDGGELDAEALMTGVTADIVFRAIFSVPLLGADAQRLYGALNRYQRLSQRALALRLFRLPGFGIERARRRQAAIIRSHIGACVDHRFDTVTLEQERSGADIVAGLRTAVDPQDGSMLTRIEVLDQVCLLFLAGHETSASALSWCMYLLAECGDLQDALRDEARGISTDGIPADTGGVWRMQRFNAVFKEVLRLYPPVGYFPREATQDEVIRGVPVPKGSELLVFPWLLHRHRRWWTEPDAFLPDRFLHRDTLPTEAVYLPFGLGERACVGAGFAAMEAGLIMAHLLSRYRISGEPQWRPGVVGRLTVRSDKGIRVRLHRLT